MIKAESLIRNGMILVAGGVTSEVFINATEIFGKFVNAAETTALTVGLATIALGLYLKFINQNSGEMAPTELELPISEPKWIGYDDEIAHPAMLIDSKKLLPKKHPTKSQSKFRG